MMAVESGMLYVGAQPGSGGRCSRGGALRAPAAGAGGMPWAAAALAEAQAARVAVTRRVDGIGC